MAPKRNREADVVVTLGRWRSGEYGAVSKSASAVISVDGVEAGSFDVVLVNRVKAGKQLHMICDAFSQELQEVSVLFNSSGIPRPEAGLLATDPSAAKGGLLYISSLQLNQAHHVDGATSVGMEAIQALLTSTALAKKWSAAVYIAEAYAQMTPAEKADESEFQMSSMARRARLMGGDGPSEEEIARKRKLTAMDARQFLRAGFDELASKGATGCWLVATQASLNNNVRTHAEACAVPLRIAMPPRPMPTGRHLELRNLFEDCISADEASLRADVARLIASGADAQRSNALHMTMFQGDARFIDLLCSHGADVNGRDGAGSTPLMVATGGQGTVAQKLACARALCIKGADKSIENDNSQTALAIMRAHATAMQDFTMTFGLLRPAPGPNPELAALLQA